MMLGQTLTLTTDRRAKTTIADVRRALRALGEEVGRARVLVPAIAASPQRLIGSGPSAATVDAARALNRASGLLALAALADSAIEHERGAFHRSAMYTPLLVGTAALLASLHGTADRRPSSHLFRDPVYAASLATGIIGTGFHLYNITKRPGGFSWHNLFYAAPIGAPASLSLAGMLGFFSERLRDAPARRAARLAGMRAGRLLAGLVAGGLVGTVAEAALLHFRGAYHNPAMYLPVTAPPIAAALLASHAIAPAVPGSRLTRWWLKLLTVLGFAGTGFHIYGVQRNMGGWRNWMQNLFNGPPLPAPPAFTALALAGLAALALMEKER